MRKLVVNEFLTLDGVMQAPGGEGEDPDGGFEHEGWQGPYFSPEMGEAVDRGMAESGGLLLGRRTYQIFAGYWPNAPDEMAEIRDPLNAMPKFVASRTLTSPLEWENSTLIEGDVADGVRALKEQDGKDLHVMGSGNLVQTLIANDLVDEYRVMIHPVVVGGGKRLFEPGLPKIGLELVDSQVASTGVIIATYRPAR